VLPDALSRSPHSAEPQDDLDDSFPDDATSKAPSDYVGPQGPTLDGVPLVNLVTFGPDDEVVMSSDEIHASSDETHAHMISALQALPFASCATLETQQTGLQRSTRSRARSVRLRSPGEPPLTLPDLHECSGRPSYSPTEVDSMVATPRTTPSSVISPEDDDDVQQVLSAGGNVAPSS
ncbi:unnamed protein product, partial [Pylaiella littoralis]